MKGMSTNITLPKPFVAELGLKHYDFVKITMEGKKIIIERPDE
jgi:bifunctional DNA-binding transcriptional regulator/antitoxin component of YhaV-PrlF toxin-antitoxin module